MNTTVLFLIIPFTTDFESGGQNFLQIILFSETLCCPRTILVVTSLSEDNSNPGEVISPFYFLPVLVSSSYSCYYFSPSYLEVLSNPESLIRLRFYSKLVRLRITITVWIMIYTTKYESYCDIFRRRRCRRSKFQTLKLALSRQDRVTHTHAFNYICVFSIR